MTLRRTLPVAAACGALFGASFAAGNAILDGEDSPAARPSHQSPPAESSSPADRPRLALALGRAAGLPGLRTPPRRATRTPVTNSAATTPPPSGAPADVAPTEVAPAAPSPAAETQPVTVHTPTQAPSPPTPPPPTESSPPSRSAPGPDAAPSAPSPSPDPAPNGGAGYEADGE
jgi:hypothetical protein